ncbi:MAG: acyl-CoA dehydrogenase family protein [Acidimicrobiia bacterium]
MDFSFSDDQDALRDAVRAFLTDRCGRDFVQAMAVDDRGFTDELWSQIVEMGWTGLLVPEEQGGLGLGLVDMTVVMEEMGRVPMPGPYFSSAVFATLAARHLGLHERLEALAAGTQRGTVALDEAGTESPIERVHTRARRRGANWVLTGVKPIVLDAHTADWVIVVARTQEGLGSFLIERPEVEPVPLLDPLRKGARLELNETPAEPVGPLEDHTAMWARIADDAAVMLAAELTGVSDRSFDLGVEYAQARVQFDKPIASHQAIQHKLVDMLHAREMARVGTYFAAWASDNDDAQRESSAAVAKSTAAEAAVKVTAENIQIHGAVGFTWEAEPHFFYKRAKQSDHLLGYQGYHRRRIADLVLGPVS